MNNWHRKIWTLEPIAPNKPLAFLFDPVGPNDFWFEPFADPVDNKLKFNAQLGAGKMIPAGASLILEPTGTDPFPEDGEPVESTERLRGTLKTGISSIDLEFFIAKKDGKDQLLFRIEASISIGDGDTGFARAN